MRYPVNKAKSKRQFNGRASKTHRLNVHTVLRGGIRL